MRKLSFFFLLALACAPAVSAQGTGTDRRWEGFVGYSNLQAEGVPQQEGNTNNSFEDRVFGERNGLNGFNASVTGYLTPRFGLTGDFSWHASDRDFSTATGTGDIDTRVINLLGGPQVRFPNQTRATPFLRSLFGIANTRFEASETRPVIPGGGLVTRTFETNATDFAMALGGGVDIRLNERVGLRAIQVDYNPVFLRERSVDVLAGAGAIERQRLESNRQDNIRLSVGVTFR